MLILYKKSAKLAFWISFYIIAAFLVSYQAVFLWPQKMQAGPNDIQLTGQVLSDGVHLFWDVGSGIDSRYDYQVIKSITPNPTYPVVGGGEIFYIAEHNTWEYIWQDNLAGETTYYFRICAYRAAVGCEFYSNTIQLATQPSTLKVDFVMPTTSEIFGSRSIQVLTNFDADTVSWEIVGSRDHTWSDTFDNNRYYSFIWETDKFPDGKYVLKATAYKTGGFVAESEYTYKINNVPETIPDLLVNLIQPTDDSLVSGEINLTASVNEMISEKQEAVKESVVTYRIRKVGQEDIIKTIFGADAGQVYQAAWDTEEVANGEYNIVVGAEKTGYNPGWDEGMIIVQNKPKESLSVSIISPNDQLEPQQSISVGVSTNLPAGTVTVEIIDSQDDRVVLGNAQAIDETNLRYKYDWQADMAVGEYTILVHALLNEENVEAAKKINIIEPESQPQPVKPPVEILVSEPEPPVVIEDKAVQINYNDLKVVILNKSDYTQSPITISAQTNYEVDKIEFSLSGPQNMVYPGIISGNKTYYFIWPVRDFPAGSYEISVKAVVGEFSARDSFDVVYEEPAYLKGRTENENLEVRITDYDPVIKEVSAKIIGESNKPLREALFSFNGAIHTTYIGKEIDENKYAITFSTDGIPNGKYTVTMTGNGQDGSLVNDSVIIEINKSQDNLLPGESPDAEKSTVSKVGEPEYEIMPVCITAGINDGKACYDYLQLDQECRNKEILNQAECQRYMNIPKRCRQLELDQAECYVFQQLDWECQEAEITNHLHCQEYLYGKRLSRDCISAGIKTYRECEEFQSERIFPKECKAAEITSEQECNKYLNRDLDLPSECLEAGIYNKQDCEYYLFDYKLSQIGLLPDSLPPECLDVGIKKEAECNLLMNQLYLPAECREQGLKSHQACDLYLQYRRLARECRTAKINTEKSCDRFLYDQYSVPECELAGIKNAEECQAYLNKRAIEKVDCEQKSAWECRLLIKNSHVGKITMKERQIKVLMKAAEEMQGTSISVDDIAMKLNEDFEALPIKKSEAKVRLSEAKDIIKLKTNTELIYEPPLFLLFDSDGDGLSDSMESRLGTNANKPDSDGDGHDDREEIIAGYNPNGVGVLRDMDLSPIDKAMLKNEKIEHAKTKGEVSDQYKIEKITNLVYSTEDKPNNNKNEASNSIYGGYIFSGTAEANKVITLYIYSDIPIVVTAKTDEFGNWVYEFNGSLQDGDHEVYVALNDASGRVVKRSDPFIFFVREARAVSVQDFVTNLPNETKTESKSMIEVYILISSLIAISGVLLYITFFFILKNRQT